jgi:hypothetical protein
MSSNRTRQTITASRVSAAVKPSPVCATEIVPTTAWQTPATRMGTVVPYRVAITSR